MATLDDALALARDHYQSGRLDEAEQVYGSIVAAVPHHVGAHYACGMIALTRGETDRALKHLHEAFRYGYQHKEIAVRYGSLCLSQGLVPHAAQALEAAGRIDPDDPDLASLEAQAHRTNDDAEKAMAACERVLRHDPGNPDARFAFAQGLLGQGRAESALRHLQVLMTLKPDQEPVFTLAAAVCLSLGRPQEGLEPARTAVRLAPSSPPARRNLGVILHTCGLFGEAEAEFKAHVSLDPASKPGYMSLASLAEATGNLDTAIACLKRALRLDPTDTDLYNRLGYQLSNCHRWQEAIACYRKALVFQPAHAAALSGLSNTLAPDAAIPLQKRAIRVFPGFVEAWNNLAGSYRRIGMAAECIQAYRQALALAPDHAAVHSNMLLSLCYVDGVDQQQLLEEHLRWADRFEAPLLARAAGKVFRNERSADRILRIGYVSGDFCDHAAVFFLAPLLEAHHRDRVHVTCYAQVPSPDGVTRYLMERADAWVDAVPLSDDALAARIEDDRIDILVDVSGHTGRNRLQVFARKPAPVQCTWLGYGATTGMKSIDYQIVDTQVTPREDAPFYTETLWHLPRPYRTFQWLIATPEVAPPPMDAKGYPTFGSLNSFVKAEPETIALWAALLHAVPEAKLFVVGHYNEASVFDKFSTHGIAADRLELCERMPLHRFLETCSREVDIALDPFPHNGGTTTFHTLWSGIPLLAIRGDRFTARIGSSMLETLGFPELVVDNKEDLVPRALAFLRNPGYLAQIRQTLRPRMAASPFLDYPGHAAAMEDAFRDMWRRWLNRTA